VVWHNPSSFTETDEYRLTATSPASGPRIQGKPRNLAALPDFRRDSATAAEAALPHFLVEMRHVVRPKSATIIPEGMRPEVWPTPGTPTRRRRTGATEVDRAHDSRSVRAWDSGLPNPVPEGARPFRARELGELTEASPCRRRTPTKPQVRLDPTCFAEQVIRRRCTMPPTR
jgi:hypothetical protein